MKKLVITSVVAVLCVAFCVFCTVYVRGTAEKAEEYTKNLETLVEKGDQKAALNEVSLFEDYWKTKICSRLFFTTKCSKKSSKA